MNDLSREKVLWWVQERLDNCHAIASAKKGVDREGWLEDAAYFEAILAWLLKPTQDDDGDTGEDCNVEDSHAR